MPLRTTKRWCEVTLDAEDVSELAHFYARMLGWRVFSESAEGASVAPSEDAGYSLGFQRDPNYTRPTWPSEPGSPSMMMHLDFEVDDLAEALTFAVECGAELAAFQPQQDVRVLLDPAGHPFCLYADT